MQIRIDPRFGDEVLRRQVEWRLRFSLARHAGRLRSVWVRLRERDRTIEVAIALHLVDGTEQRVKAENIDPQRALDWALDHLLRELARRTVAPMRRR